MWGSHHRLKTALTVACALTQAVTVGYALTQVNMKVTVVGQQYTCCHPTGQNQIHHVHYGLPIDSRAVTVGCALTEVNAKVATVALYTFSHTPLLHCNFTNQILSHKLRPAIRRPLNRGSANTF